MTKKNMIQRMRKGKNTRRMMRFLGLFSSFVGAFFVFFSFFFFFLTSDLLFSCGIFIWVCVCAFSFLIFVLFYFCLESCIFFFEMVVVIMDDQVVYEQ